MDDIPEALRDKPKTKTSLSQPSFLMIGGLVTVGAIGLLLGVFLLRPQSSSITSSSATPEATPVNTAIPQSSPEIENVLGHLPYKEALETELKAITTDGTIRLQKAAADEFLQMQKAAKASGIILIPLSGFRSITAQNQLFFGVKQQRNQDARKRAEVSAPPGYSEHHTGYAVDIGDGKTPATNLSQGFDKTAAFSWLKNNAAKYSFEMSFPMNNPQRVSYEPWHWRYVGDRQSLETFYKAKNLLNTK